MVSTFHKLHPLLTVYLDNMIIIGLVIVTDMDWSPNVSKLYVWELGLTWTMQIYICGEVATKRSNILESPFTMLTWRMEDILGTVNKLYDQIAGQ